MKVELVGGAPLSAADQASIQSQQSARERAIAMIKGNSTAQEHPVSNPSKVSPEELSAVNSGQNSVSEEPIVEIPAAAPALDKDKELLSTQYAQLARREKALYAKAQARDRAIAEREAALQAREKAIEAQDSEYKTNYIPKQRITEDTINVLLESGVSYDKITEMMLNQTQQDPATKVAIAELKSQLRAQEEARKADRQALEEAQNANYLQAVKQIRADASQLVMTDPQFETIKKTKSIGDVVSLIEETFKEDGIVLSVEDACREVEEHLVEKLSQYSQIDKIQQRMKANASKSSPQLSGQDPTQRQPKPTLTNAVGTSKKLTAKERAVLAFKGELQKS
jgi:hypothetical protein